MADRKRTAGISVDGFRFENRAEAEQARKEVEGVRYIRERMDIENPQLMLQIYNKMAGQELFETAVGFAYLRGLQEYLASVPSVRNEDILPIQVRHPILEEELRRGIIAEGLGGAPGKPGGSGNQGMPGATGKAGMPDKPEGAGIKGAPGNRDGERNQGMPGATGKAGMPDKPEGAGIKGAPGNRDGEGNRGMPGDLGKAGIQGIPGKQEEAGMSGRLEGAGTRGTPGKSARAGSRGAAHGDYRRKYRAALVVCAALAACVVAMFAITATSDNVTILNYKTELVNRYEAWEQELTEREAEVKQREQELGLD